MSHFVSILSLRIVRLSCWTIQVQTLQPGTSGSPPHLSAFLPSLACAPAERGLTPVCFRRPWPPLLRPSSLCLASLQLQLCASCRPASGTARAWLWFSRPQLFWLQMFVFFESLNVFRTEAQHRHSGCFLSTTQKWARILPCHRAGPRLHSTHSAWAPLGWPLPLPALSHSHLCPCGFTIH